MCVDINNKNIREYIKCTFNNKTNGYSYIAQVHLGISDMLSTDQLLIMWKSSHIIHTDVKQLYVTGYMQFIVSIDENY